MIQFRNLEFQVIDGQLLLTRCGNLTGVESGIAQVQIAGENKNSHLGAKMADSSEGGRLRFVSAEEHGGVLIICQNSPLVTVRTEFAAYDDTNALRIRTIVTNTTAEPLVLEEVSACYLEGIGGRKRRMEPDGMYFTCFRQSHHAECQPSRSSFRELGLTDCAAQSQTRVSHCNVGSWSTKEALPMGIVEDSQNGHFLMFQIESSNSWYYELSDRKGENYLWLGGANLPFGGWSKCLQPGENYTTPWTALAFGGSLNDVLAQMTRYRRHIAGRAGADAALPTIFNEYMHLSWDSPTAERTAQMAPIAAKTGVEYYVIDCGWHNEEPGDKIYPYVGQWKESQARFPEGLRKTTDLVRACGMKPGLWIEPEIIGNLCEEMLGYYDESCYLQRYGRKLTVMNRHFLDFRSEKVRTYLTETIRRMVEDYGAAYIKCDYNQDCGVGTDRDAFTAADGLEQHNTAFLTWLEEMTRRYPDVIFEGCASGGLRMDYRTLGVFSLVSTSDQTNYLLYPYIAGNILSAVLPEQAAVWSYPVTEDCETVSDDRIVLNMINSFLGRMHLASHLERLDNRQLALIREGVDYYHSLTEMKKTAVPYFPMGFTYFGAEQVCSGLRHENRLYLAVWRLKGEPAVQIPLSAVREARIAYPREAEAVLTATADGVTVSFPRTETAVFLEIDLAE